jgi:hypothetical protein
MNRRHTCASIVAAALLLALAAIPAWSQTREQAQFKFNTEFMLGIGSGYVLPPGHYMLELAGKDGLFRLLMGDDASSAKPVAVIDAWDTLTKVERPTAQDQAELKILEPGHGEPVRALQGFYLQGNYYKIRDVLAIDTAMLTPHDS